MENGLPKKQGLYDPQFEHDACGIGCIANIKGRKSHGIVNQGIQILKNLAHRGGVGSEPDTGDGAGILIQMPHKFMQKVCKNEGIELPEKGDYGVGMLFLSPDRETREESLKTLSGIIAEERCRYMMSASARAPRRQCLISFRYLSARAAPIWTTMPLRESCSS